MKKPLLCLLISPRILAFILPLFLPLYASSDLLGDLNQAVDLLEKAGGVLSDKNKSPTSTPQPSPKAKTVSSSPSQDLTAIFSQPEYYFQRPQYFDSLGFELGNFIVVEPLDKTSFNPLYVASYKGLPRLSLTPEYKQLKIDYSANGGILKTYRNAVVEHFHNDMLIYHNLRLLDLMSQYVTEENLKIDNSGQAQNRYKTIDTLFSVKEKLRSSDTPFYTYVPRYHIEGLVSTLRPATHQQYLGDPNDCYSSSGFSRHMISWGGTKNNNEFKSRRAYFSFIETEVPKLKAWAKSLPRESYIVGTVTLGEYDFKRKGFDLSLYPPRGIPPKQIFSYAPRNPSKRVFIDINDADKHHVFFSISESDAEALQERIKQPHGRPSQLYFAVKGEVYGPQDKGSDSSRHGPTYAGIHLAYDVTGSTIKFFSDELLKDKIFEVSIK